MVGWVNVASILRLKSRNEGFVLRCKTNPSAFAPGLRVAFVPPALDCVREGTLRSVAVLSEREVCVTFCEAEVAACASALVGMDVLAREDTLPELLDDGGTEVLGWRVFDVRFGEIGRVADVLDGPAQQLLVVVPEAGGEGEQAKEGAPAASAAPAENPSAKAAEILIPYVDAFVTAHDDETRTLHVAIPAGLLTLGCD